MDIDEIRLHLFPESLWLNKNKFGVDAIAEEELQWLIAEIRAGRLKLLEIKFLEASSQTAL